MQICISVCRLQPLQNVLATGNMPVWHIWNKQTIFQCCCGEASKLIPSFICELIFGTVSGVVSTIGNIFKKDKKEEDKDDEEIKKIKYKHGKSKKEEGKEDE